MRCQVSRRRTVSTSSQQGSGPLSAPGQDRSQPAPDALGRRAALTLNRPVGAADPQRSLMSVAVRA